MLRIAHAGSSAKEQPLAAEKYRLTLDLEPSFMNRLKAVAASKGVTVQEYCLAAIERQMARDEADGISGPASSR